GITRLPQALGEAIMPGSGIAQLRPCLDLLMPAARADGAPQLLDILWVNALASAAAQRVPAAGAPLDNGETTLILEEQVIVALVDDAHRRPSRPCFSSLRRARRACRRRSCGRSRRPAQCLRRAVPALA